MKRAIKDIVIKIKFQLSKNEKIKQSIKTFLERFPTLNDTIKALINSAAPIQVIRPVNETHIEYLKTIKKEVEQHKKSALKSRCSA